MIDCYAALLFQVLNQWFILSFDFIRWCVNFVDNFFISKAFQLVFGWNSLIKLIENMLELIFDRVDHVISLLDWLLSSFFCLFANIFLFDNLLEDSFIICEIVLSIRRFITFNSWSELVELIFVFLKFSFCSWNLEPWFILNLLLIHGQERFGPVTNGQTSW